MRKLLLLTMAMTLLVWPGAGQLPAEAQMKQIQRAPAQELQQPDTDGPKATQRMIDRTRPMLRGQGVLQGGGLDFKCNSETRKCTCRDAQDCLEMGRAGVCEGPSLCGDQIPGPRGPEVLCECDWKL